MIQLAKEDIECLSKALVEYFSDVPLRGTRLAEFINTSKALLATIDVAGYGDDFYYKIKCRLHTVYGGF